MQSKSFIRQSRFLIISILSIALMGCFGTGDGKSSGGVGTSTGKLTFSDAEGITFKTPTREGVTGPDSVFSYLPGESVTFAIGSVEDGIILGTVQGAPIITAYQLTGSSGGMLKLDSPAANLIRFIHSLDDKDGNREYLDGVTIPESVRMAANDPGKPELDFFADKATFDAQLQAVVDYLFVIPRTASSVNALNNFCNYTFLRGGGSNVFGYAVEGCTEGVAVQLLQNGGFEEGKKPFVVDVGDIPNGWTDGFNFPDTPPGDRPDAIEGASALKLSGPNYFTQDFPEPEGVGIFQDFTPVPLQRYTASLKAQNFEGGLFSPNFFIMEIVFSSDGDFEDGVGEQSASLFATGDPDDPDTKRAYLPPDEWTDLEVTGIAPLDTVAARLLVLHLQFPGTEEHSIEDNLPDSLRSGVFIDDVMLVGPTYEKDPPVDYELVWSDEFTYVDGNIDLNTWMVETGYGPVFNQGWGNNEWQNYTGDPRNLRIEPNPSEAGDGVLTITGYCDYLENPGNGEAPAEPLLNAGFELPVAPVKNPDGPYTSPDDDAPCYSGPIDNWTTSGAFGVCNNNYSGNFFVNPVALSGSNQNLAQEVGASAYQDVAVEPGQNVSASVSALHWAGFNGDGYQDPAPPAFDNLARFSLIFLDIDHVALPGESTSVTADSSDLGGPKQGFDEGDWTTLPIPAQIAPDEAHFARIQLEHEAAGGTENGPVWWEDAKISVSNPLCDVKVCTLAQEAAGEPGCFGRNGAFTSARINSSAAVDDAASSILYGKIEAMMKVPVGMSSWAAFWMLGTSFDPMTGIGWPKSGEIDTMESWIGAGGGGSTASETTSAVHWCPRTDEEEEELTGSCNFDDPEDPTAGPVFSTGRLDTGASLADDFHLYAVEWNPERLLFTFDGQEVFRRNIDPDMEEFKQPFYMILNLAIGGNLGSNGATPTLSGNNWDLPQTMEVDYVRLYKAKP